MKKRENCCNWSKIFWKEMFFVLVGIILLLIPLQANAATVTEREDNNTFGTANAVNLGDSINGSITQTDNLDIYRINVNSAGKLAMDMTSYMRYYCSKLYAADGTQIWYTYDNEYNSNVGYRKDTYNLYLEKGVYYIEVNGYERGNYGKTTGTYQLSLGFTSSNVTNREPDNSFATANQLTLGSTAVGQISENDNYDNYRFQITSSGRITTKITSYMQNYTLRLYNQDGDEVWYSDYNEWNANVGYRTDTYDWDLEKGIYYIEITGYRAYTFGKSMGKYSFTTSFRSSNANNREPNDTFATAQSLSWNKVVNGQIALNDDYDLYRFDCSTGQKLTISITSYMPNYCINIYDIMGKNVWNTEYNSWNEHVKYRKDTHQITLSKGSYYLEVNGYRWSKYSKTTGNYSFKISDGKISSLALSKTSLTLAHNKTAKLTAKASPSSNGPFIWSSSNKNVVTVSSQGVITAKYPGTATVYCTAADGSKKKASCRITVTPSKGQIAKVSAGKRRAVITWKKITGVSGYDVYMSQYSKSGFKTIKSINRGTTTTYKKTGLKSGRRYYFKVRGYKLISGKKVYGSFSSTASTRAR